MSGRYSGWRKLKGDTADRPDLLDLGKKLLGYLDNQRTLSGVPTMGVQTTLPDGSVVWARWLGNLPEIMVKEGSGGAEDVLYLFITSDAGLLIYDMAKQVKIATITGLNHYEVDAVASDGKTVFLTGGLYDKSGHAAYRGFGVRADLTAMEAVTTSGLYVMDSARRGAYLPFSLSWYEYELVDGYPMITGAQLSPDNQTLLWHFGAERDADGLILNGIGGYVVADAETLAQKRTGIRTHGQPSAAAWAPDSEHFFITSCFNTEHPPGVWWIEEAVAPWWKPSAAANPDAMYLMKYTAAGEIAASVLVVEWVPAAGQPSPTGMTASDEYVFLLYYSDPFATLTLAAYAMADLSLAGSIDLTGNFGDVCVMGNGNIALVYAPGGARVFRFTDGAFSLVEDTGNTVLGTNAVQTTNSAVQEYRNGVIQRQPNNARFPTPTASFYYVRDGSQYKVRCLGSFLDGNGDAREGGYVLDMTADAPNERYRIAHVGTRQTRKPR